MMVRCLRSSFAWGRFFCSSSVVESFISSTVETDATKPTNAEVSTQNTTYSNKSAYGGQNSLASRFFAIQKYDSGVAATVISKWKEEGHLGSKSQILYAVRGLKHRKRYTDALMICDSMLELKDLKLSPNDYALHLGLIFKVRGLQSAEQFFDSIPEEMKNENTFSTLLFTLVRKTETEKAEALMEKMKKSGFLPNPEPYIHMKYLYFSKKQFDKAKEMDNEVKKCIPPNIDIYNMWLSACSDKKDVEGAERAFAHMKDAKVEANWLTHRTLVCLYVKMLLFVKADAALKDLEGVAPPVSCSSLDIYCFLMRMHGNMGNKDEVLRIWDKLKSKIKMNNRGYNAMLRTIMKHDFEKAKEIFKEWQSFPKSITHKYIVFRSMLQKIHPNGIPEDTEEDKVESMV